MKEVKETYNNEREVREKAETEVKEVRWPSSGLLLTITIIFFLKTIILNWLFSYSFDTTTVLSTTAAWEVLQLTDVNITDLKRWNEK